MAFSCYATLAQLRQRSNPPNTNDDLRAIGKLRDVSSAIKTYCGGRDFQPSIETRTFDWESNEYLSFRSFDLLTLTSLLDGTGNTKAVAALIMQGGRFSDATKYGPWYAVRIDVTKDFLLYNVTPFRAMQISGVWGFHDDYGIAGANAFIAVYTDATLGAALNGTVADATTRIITTSADPTISVDAELQGGGGVNGGAISAGSFIQIESEWMQVLATSASSTITVQRGANGSTPVAHAAKPISVFQPVNDIREAATRWAQFLLRQDDAPLGKVLMPTLNQVIVPFEIPPDVRQLLDPYAKVRVI